VFFLPIVACPAIALATADLPMGKKRKTLCARACRAVAFAEAGGSVVITNFI